MLTQRRSLRRDLGGKLDVALQQAVNKRVIREDTGLVEGGFALVVLRFKNDLAGPDLS